MPGHFCRPRVSANNFSVKSNIRQMNVDRHASQNSGLTDWIVSPTSVVDEASGSADDATTTCVSMDKKGDGLNKTVCNTHWILAILHFTPKPRNYKRFPAQAMVQLGTAAVPPPGTISGAHSSQVQQIIVVQTKKATRGATARWHTGQHFRKKYVSPTKVTSPTQATNGLDHVW